MSGDGQRAGNEDKWEPNSGGGMVINTPYTRTPARDYGASVPRDYALAEVMFVNEDGAANVAVVINGKESRNVAPNSTLTVDESVDGPIRMYRVTADAAIAAGKFYALETPKRSMLDRLAGTRVKVGY